MECIPNPFTTESFVLNDINKTSIKVCDNSMDITIDYKHCYKECPKQCKQIYTKSNVKASIDNFIGDSYLKIEKYHGKQFSYQAENELSLIKYFADLGGLFGLYFGIAFVQFGTLINQSIKHMKQFLNYFMHLEIFKIIIRLRRSLQKLNFILNIIQRIDFTLLTKLIFPPILIYQIFSMFDLYFQYSTQTNYNFIPYNISNNKYSLNEFPAITVCNEQMFDKIWFKDYYDPELIDLKLLKLFSENDAKVMEGIIIDDCKQFRLFISYINKHIINEHVEYFLFKLIDFYREYYIEVMTEHYVLKHYEEESYKDVNRSMFCDEMLIMVNFVLDNLLANNQDEFQKSWLRFEDKYTYGLNSTKQLFDFYGKHYRCVTNEPSIDCSLFSQKLSLLSPLGKCHTFFYNNDINQTHVKSIDIFLNLLLVDGSDSIFEYPNYLNFKVLLHEKYSTPNDGSIEIIPIFNHLLKSYDMNIELKKTVIKRLEKPYDTECHDYGQSNQINCLNTCYIKMYQNTFHCLPNTNNYHTIILNNISRDDERNVFCPNYLEDNITKYKINLNHHCNSKCGIPCHEVFHDVDITSNYPSNDELKINFYSNDTTYRSIKYEPKISMMEFLINLFNIWNLWHGTSLITVLVILADISKKLFRFVPIPTTSFNPRILIKIISSMLLILFIEKIISLTINYLQFDTITKINLLDYEDDTNYPYLSFTLEEAMIHLMVNLANFKSNFTMIPKNKLPGYDPSLESRVFGDHLKNFKNYSIYYDDADIIEFLINRFNISKQDLFNQEFFRNYCLSGNLLYIPNDDYSLTIMNEHNLSYSTIFE